MFARLKSLKPVEVFGAATATAIIAIGCVVVGLCPAVGVLGAIGAWTFGTLTQDPTD